MLAVLTKHAMASFRRRRTERRIEELKGEVKTFNKVMSDCEIALRLFGYDIDDEADWKRLMEKHRSQVFDRLERENLLDPPAEIDGEATEGPPAPPAPALPPKSELPTIQEILLERLQEAGDKGSKAAPLRHHIHQTYNVEIHEKTVGMTLYRLLKKGLVRREGHVWFFVPQDAETKNPGAPTPGLFEGR